MLRALGGLALVGAVGLLVACGGPDGVRLVEDRTPKKLSDWGVLQKRGGSLQLADGVLPYELNTSLFTDYAHKLRTVWMPEGALASVGDEGRIEFPEGTILSKTFYYPLAASTDGAAAGGGVVHARRSKQLNLDWRQDGLSLADNHLVETRILVRRPTGWLTLPYVWNEEQTEASLEIIGAESRVELVSDDGNSEPFLYIVPDANQCSGCHVTNHTLGRPEPIGPKLRHLNREVTVLGATLNQLELWGQRGFLPAIDAQSAPRVVEALDSEAGTIDERARAYLDINCGHCHNAKGPADTSGLFLDASIDEARRLGACKPPIAAGRGSGDRLVSIHPGQSGKSIMPYRMNSTDPGIAMPELGRSTVHREGVELISQWIDSLAGDCSPALGVAAGL